MDACAAIMNDRDGNICKDLLPRITCPTLIVHGEKDALVAPEHPQYLKESIKGSRYEPVFPIENRWFFLVFVIQSKLLELHLLSYFWVRICRNSHMCKSGFLNCKHYVILNVRQLCTSFSCRIEIFPDGKHNLHKKYAKEFNKIVCDFITSS